MVSLLVIIVAGNKCDMVQDRCVPQEVWMGEWNDCQDIDTLCKEENLIYIETSALSGVGVSDVFKRIGSTFPFLSR